MTSDPLQESRWAKTDDASVLSRSTDTVIFTEIDNVKTSKENLNVASVHEHTLEGQQTPIGQKKKFVKITPPSTNGSYLPPHLRIVQKKEGREPGNKDKSTHIDTPHPVHTVYPQQQQFQNMDFNQYHNLTMASGAPYTSTPTNGAPTVPFNTPVSIPLSLQPMSLPMNAISPLSLPMSALGMQHQLQNMHGMGSQFLFFPQVPRNRFPQMVPHLNDMGMMGVPMTPMNTSISNEVMYSSIPISASVGSMGSSSVTSSPIRGCEATGKGVSEKSLSATKENNIAHSTSLTSYPSSVLVTPPSNGGARRMAQTDPLAGPRTRISLSENSSPIGFNHDSYMLVEGTPISLQSSKSRKSLESIESEEYESSDDGIFSPNQVVFGTTMRGTCFGETVGNGTVSVPPANAAVLSIVAPKVQGDNRPPTLEDVCTGCGSPRSRSFVFLVPCSHLLCAACMNSLINAAAHTPPRPMNCYACTVRVESFRPAGIATANVVKGDSAEGIIGALRDSWRNGEFKRDVNTESVEVVAVEEAVAEPKMIITSANIYDDPRPETYRAKSWTVLRLDNIPWDITIAEVKAFLPADCLPPKDECVLPIHILCNRSDGRTLNQGYVEVASVQKAREVVKTRDGKRLRGRSVHVTISDQGELMATTFPSWTPGFKGIKAQAGPLAGPLILQTELTGLISLCKLESPHAAKVIERAYCNIVTILQKFPWHQQETYNSKQIVRLYNTSFAAVEIILAIRDGRGMWKQLLQMIGEAVVACPVFRNSQKIKLLRKAGVMHPLVNVHESVVIDNVAVPSETAMPAGPPPGLDIPYVEIKQLPLNFTPPSLTLYPVGVGINVTEDGSPDPERILRLAPHLKQVPAEPEQEENTPPSPSPIRPVKDVVVKEVEEVKPIEHEETAQVDKKEKVEDIALSMGLEMEVVMKLMERLKGVAQ